VVESDRATLKFNMNGFNLKNLNYVEVKSIRFESQTDFMMVVIVMIVMWTSEGFGKALQRV
jgi:hypothetical protein